MATLRRLLFAVLPKPRAATVDPLFQSQEERFSAAYWGA